MKEPNVFTREDGELTPPHPRFIQMTPILNGDPFPELSVLRGPPIILLPLPESPWGPEGRSLSLRWKESPFSFQGEPSNLGAIYFIESLGRQTGPTTPQWQSGHPYSYTVLWPSCTQWLYPPRSPPWPIPERLSPNPAPEIFLPSLSRAIPLHDRLPWGSLHIQRLITVLFQIVQRLLQGSGSLPAPPHVEEGAGRWVDHYSNPSLLLWGPLKGRILRFGIWKGTGPVKLLTHTQWLPPFCPLWHVERLSQQRLGDICLLWNKGQSRCQPGFSVVSQDPILPLQCPDPSKWHPNLDPVMNLSRLRKIVKDRRVVLGVTKSRTWLSHWTVKQQQQKWGRENGIKSINWTGMGGHRKWIFWNWLKYPPWGRKGAPARKWVVELFNILI